MKTRTLKSLFRRKHRNPVEPEGRELINHNGLHYLDCIEALAKAMGAERYLEIGTSTGASLARIECASIAIDPEFKIKIPVTGMKPACHLYQMTSDNYFERHDPKPVLGGTIDLAFLDGMHRYEFLLKDFMNTEKHCAKNSIILLHDCLPPTFEMTNREGAPGRFNKAYKHYWTGDVWKVVAILKAWRSDLKMFLLDCPPTGLVAISNLDPGSEILAQNYLQIVSDYSSKTKDFGDLQAYIAANQPASSKTLSPSDLLHNLGR